MRKAKVVLRPQAEADLFALHRYIASEASPAVAEKYFERIIAACLSLSTFPERGTRRDDLQPGIRTIGFERRATIVFRVVDREAEILRVFYGGQDFESIIRDS